MNTLELNVRELTLRESVEIEGGIAPLIIYGGLILLGIATGICIRSCS